ncbi:IS21 family transposase [Fodinibius roseus]|nr:IS21 family transposase [Fodinibius roseus]
MELRQLIQLKGKGLSNRKVAEALGMSRNTVNSYVQAFSQQELSYQQLQALSEAELVGLFPQTDYKDKSRYEQLFTYFPEFAKELRKTGCTMQVLWNRYLETHPDGYRYTQFVHHFNQWKDKTKASGILRHQAGRKLFMDFAGKTLSWVDRDTGEIHPAQVFVAILPCSQYTYVQATKAQKREDLVRALTDCKSWLGGVTKAIVGDNMKAVVAKGHKYAPVINKTLKDLALHYGCVIDPTRPYHPKDKALVEGAIRLVYQRIYYPLSNQTFFSVAELNGAIRELLVCYNDYRFQNRPTTRRQQFLEIEQPALDPLPPTPYQLRHYKRAKVQKISHIYLGTDKNYYSVPHRYVGRHVEVQYTADVVEVFYDGERIAHHKRSRTAGKYTTIGTHMPSTHQVYNDWNPDWFAQRAARIGPYAKSYIRRLIAQYDYPEIGYKQAQGILALTKTYPAERVEAACRRAAQGHRAGYRTIANILKNNLDQNSEPELPLDNHIPDHGNIRGGTNYN